MKGLSALYLKRSLPTILAFVGSAGVVGTAVLAVMATPKALTHLKEAEESKGSPLSFKEKAYNVWPCYIPSAVVGLSTIACIFGANALNRRAQTSLASAYGLLNQAYQRYREAAKAVYGQDADEKIIAEVARAVYVSENGRLLYSEEYDPDSEKVLCYDTVSQRYFSATMASVLNAQYHFNRNMQLIGYVMVNEFYDFLGIDKVSELDGLGWNMDELMEGGYMWFDFHNINTKMEDGMECVVIHYDFLPGGICP